MLKPADCNPRHVVLRRVGASEPSSDEMLASKVCLPWKIPEERDVMKRLRRDRHRVWPIVAARRSIERRERHRHAVETGLDRAAAQARVEIFRHPIAAVDGEKLGLEPAAEDARRAVARGPGKGPAPERAVDVDRAAGDNLGAGTDRADHRHVALRDSTVCPERTESSMKRHGPRSGFAAGGETSATAGCSGARAPEISPATTSGAGLPCACSSDTSATSSLLHRALRFADRRDDA